MSTYIKPLVVLIISVLLFAGFTYLADKELFNYVQTHFYNPSIINSVVKENSKNAELVQSHIFELQSAFAATLKEQAVCNSFMHNQSAGDIYERSRIFGILLESVPGLQSVQFIDNNGIRLHYSTSPRDVISQTRESAAYRNYTEDTSALPYEQVSVPANGKAKFTMDDAHDRIIFSFPFFDSLDVYRGTAIFNLSIRALAEKLIAEGRLKTNENISVTGKPPGVVFGSPSSSKTTILEKIAAIWAEGKLDIVVLDAEDSGIKYAFISTKTGQDLFFGRLINNSLFSIPNSMKLVLKLSMFLTFYLTIFLLINLKPHPVTVIRNRLKHLRTNLFEHLYVNKSSKDRLKWILELEQRREEIRSELKHNLRMSRRTGKNIDIIIDKAWDELLAVMKSGSIHETVLKDAHKTAAAKTLEDAEEIEEIIEASQEVEEIAEEIEKFDAVEEITYVEEEEAIRKLEEEAESIEEIEEIEEIADAEEPEAIDEVIDEFEEITFVEEAEAFDGFDEAAYDEEPETIDAVEGTSPAGSGLLKLASGYEKDEPEDTEEPAPHAGLFKLASNYEKDEDTEEIEEPVPHAGLFKLASSYEKDEGIEEIDDLEELEETESPDSEDSVRPSGLLALASSKEKSDAEPAETPRGLLAVASEIEFGSSFPVAAYDNEEDLDTEELDIVSPFSSMFSSLEEDKKD